MQEENTLYGLYSILVKKCYWKRGDKLVQQKVNRCLGEDCFWSKSRRMVCQMGSSYETVKKAMTMSLNGVGKEGL